MMSTFPDPGWAYWDDPELNASELEHWSNQTPENGLVPDLELGLHTECTLAPPAKRRKVSAITSMTTTATNTTGVVALTLPKSRKPPAAVVAAVAATTNTAKKSTKKGKPISSHIPFEIWLEIFSHCPPSQLAKLRRLNSSFRAFIDDEKLWARSRQNTFPNYPEPMYGYPENYMWNLWRGSGCVICGAARFKKCYWTWGIRLCTSCFKDNRIRGDEIIGEREFVNAALVCLRHCFVSGKFVSTQRGNYYGLGGGDPCYWKGEVTAFRAAYEEKKRQEVTTPGILATFIEFERDKARVDMETAVRMCDFERQDRSHIPSLPTEVTARREERAEIRRQRLISIPEKCKAYFTPPIPDGVLELIPSYQTALKAASVLTNRGWKTLVTKITGERAKAETDYRNQQEVKERAHREYMGYRRKARSEETRDHRNLLKLRGEMGELVKSAKEFIKKEGGYLIIDRSRAQSFVLETMKFCRRRWYEKNEDQTLPFRAMYFLWEEVLEGATKIFEDASFCCEYCHENGTWEEIVFHLASEHPGEPGMEGLARTPVEFAAEEKVILKRPIPNWDGVEWPEKIPILSTGLKFTPRTFKDKNPSLNCPSTIASNKPRKPRKPGTLREDTICQYSINNSLPGKFQKPQTTPRNLISRIIVEVSELRVPHFFQLSLFFRKMVAEFKRYKLRVEFNELFYEFIRLCDQDRKAPLWFSHDTLVCNACLHTWDGVQSIVTLMQHFFESHHPSYDWRKDMLLMPGPPDVLGMLQQVSDFDIGHRWDSEAREYELDSSSARLKQSAADRRGEGLCSVEELKALQMLKRAGEGVGDGVERRLGEIMMSGEVGGGFERKRKWETEDGKGKGKERDGTPYDEFEGSEVESEKWEETFDMDKAFTECERMIDVGWYGGLDVEMNIDE